MRVVSQNPLLACPGGRLTQDLIAAQLEYYSARAGEYDEWFLRQGRYDKGPEGNAAWNRDVAAVREYVGSRPAVSSTVELACGTGLWTELLLERTEHLVALDGSAEMLAVCARRVSGRGVQFQQRDLFDWVPERQFDRAFAGFFLSHVPRSMLERMLLRTAEALIPGGEFVFVDSLQTENSMAADHPPVEGGVAERTLSDGRTYHVVKEFYQPEELSVALASAGLLPDVRTTGEFFVYGSAVKPIVE